MRQQTLRLSREGRYDLVDLGGEISCRNVGKALALLLGVEEILQPGADDF